jgi:actin-like ATPase involved in cell morphogenesis
MVTNHPLNPIFLSTRREIAVQAHQPVTQSGTPTTEIKRLNVKIGAPMSITTGDEETREALQEPLATIISVIMRGLDKMIEEKTTLKVFIPEDPLLSIIKEAGVVLDGFSNMKKVCIS